MKKYEIMLLNKGSKGEQVAKDTFEAVKNKIVELGGELVSEDYWGKRKLAYKIGQETEGFYSVNIFNLNLSKVTTLKQNLNLMENLVRYLVSAKAE